MRNKILKLAFRFSAFAFAVGMTGCDALDLAPIDTYGSGNFWTRKEHVIAYMDGIHKNFRDQMFFGENHAAVAASRTRTICIR